MATLSVNMVCGNEIDLIVGDGATSPAIDASDQICKIEPQGYAHRARHSTRRGI